jgi:hypothetical protein
VSIRRTNRPEIEPTMRFSKPLPFSIVALLALATCHSDATCVYDSDCNSQGGAGEYVCVPDSSGWGHCMTAADIFGTASSDGGVVATTSCGDAGVGTTSTGGSSTSGGSTGANSTGSGSTGASSTGGSSTASSTAGGSTGGSSTGAASTGGGTTTGGGSTGGGTTIGGSSGGTTGFVDGGLPDAGTCGTPGADAGSFTPGCDCDENSDCLSNACVGEVCE